MQTCSLFTRTGLSGMALAAVALLGSGSAQAVSITDPVGDFLPTFAGSVLSADLDVIDATVTYNPTTNIFTLSSTQAGAVGLTPTGTYIWGVNRGAGVATFASIGITGVRFDATVRLNPNGTGSIGATALPPGAVTVSGNVISASFSGSLLPSTGFNLIDYTWNLWPRDTAFTGTAAISDFAPNNANFTVTVVPEPATALLMLGGVAALMLRRRSTAAR
ncbi:PEP-CTERM sorting domain-containing protein [Rubrivivax rivuli]|nr:PEP-CTERM sorting domain-containing protein [Rubrivivax rivuli]